MSPQTDKQYTNAGRQSARREKCNEKQRGKGQKEPNGEEKELCARDLVMNLADGNSMMSCSS